MPSFPWLPEALTKLHEEGLHRSRSTVTSLPDGRCELNGQTLWNLAGNDYLNLAHDPRVITSAKSVLDNAGIGARASALVTGRTKWHELLEQKLAEFEGEPAALVFPTGYAANVGTITALVGPDDMVFCDRMNHASIVDGCRLSGARLRIFRHDRLEQLEKELSKSSRTARNLIVTDSVFSMDGDLAPLREICDLAGKFEAEVMIDEAHATGIFGKQGRGVAELQQVESRIAVRIGTLSKGIGCLGGFVTGSDMLIDWLWNRARTQIYSTALPPSICAAATTALEIIQTESEQRTSFLDRCESFREKLRSANLPLSENSIGPIVPLIVQDSQRAIELRDQLMTDGYLVAAIRPPTVPRGTARLRISLTAAHTEERLNAFAEKLAERIGATR